MKLFNVIITDTGEELCVAARTTDHAAQVLVTFWFARTDSAPGDFSVGVGMLSSYENEATVEAVAAGDVAGVLVRQPDGSMLFEAAIF